ncbi:ATP-binding protein [bacterium]|nr:MAG: ATP-binding protein [bacterium]
MDFHKLENSQESLLKFIKYGGMPYLMNLDLSDEIIYGYLKSVYNTIILKDVVNRYKIRNINFLDNLIEYLADNVGSLVSAKKISDFLKSQKIKISPNIVLDYLSFLVNAFFVFKVPRSDVQGKKVFEVNNKYYFEDLGLRHSVVSYRQTDINKILENLVFSHLQVLGYQVTVGQLEDKEIDFVCEKHDKKMYIQVAYKITDENKKREFENLLEIKDNYPKIVVSMDDIKGESEYKGIKHVNVIDFLSATKL